MVASSSSPRYLVTGGGGFIGSNMVEALLARGERVRVLDDFSTGRRQNLAAFEGSGLEVIEASVVDTHAVQRAMQGVEVVLHQAALASVPRSVERPLDTDRVNVHGTLTLLEGARAAGVRRFIYAGSSSAYGNTPTLPKREDMTPYPLSPYAVSKLAGEHYVRAYAAVHRMETLTIRYFNVFGPRQDPNGAYAAVIPRWCLAALRGEPITVYGDGKQTRDFCYIANVVHAGLLAANVARRLAGEVLNVSCGESITLLQLADAIADEVGHPVARSHVEARTGDVRDSLADISLAREMLDYTPQVLWRDGLTRTLAALRSAP